MNIGIITFHRAMNYGAFLQILALQDYLIQIGEDVCIIDYILYDKHVGTKWNNLPALGWVLNWYRKNAAKRKLAGLHGDTRLGVALNLTRKYNSISELQESPPKCDVYICGSDQIWNPDCMMKEGLFDGVDAYFLNFGSDTTKRVAYAASTGVADLPAHFLARIKPFLERFSFVGVRESATIQSLRKIGVAADQVCDPTLLMHADFYRRLMPASTSSETSYFAYLIRTQLAKGFKVSLAEQGYQYRAVHLKTDKHLPSAFEWLRAIHDAECVITDSFHCVIFCLLFRTPFIALGAAGKHEGMNERLMNLLGLVNLEKLLLNSGELELSRVLSITRNIDWPHVELKLSAFAKESKQLIRDALD